MRRVHYSNQGVCIFWLCKCLLLLSQSKRCVDCDVAVYVIVLMLAADVCPHRCGFRIEVGVAAVVDV